MAVITLQIVEIEMTSNGTILMTHTFEEALVKARCRLRVLIYYFFKEEEQGVNVYICKDRGLQRDKGA